MSANELVTKLVKAGFDVHTDAVLDALWLASLPRDLSIAWPEKTIPPPRKIDPPDGFVDGRAPDQCLDEKLDPNNSGNGGDKPLPSPVVDRGLYSYGEVAGEDMPIRASPILLPSAHALTHRLSLLRGLRPFCRRFPSYHACELDEDRTVELTAETSLPGSPIILPVLRPKYERWYDVHVVIEDDPTIEVWAAPLREFAQLLSNAGAFRLVRTWRLQLDPGEPSALAKARLVTPAGGASSPRVLGNSRQLILFASHGNSAHWVDGVYAELLASWPAASVGLLHLMPRQRWAHSLLGEPQGLAHTPQPGSANSALQIDPFWWRSAPDPNAAGVVRLPAFCVEPLSFDGWARMQMALGRQAEVFLLDPADRLTEEEAAELQPVQMEATLAISNLRERSSRAYDLAIMLASAPFTLPVARVVQEVTQDQSTDFSVLAELMTSGLVVPRAGDSTIARETTYFMIRDEARPLLLRALRGADADGLVDSLEQRISKHLTDIEGRAVQFSALVASAEGNARLPAWAKQFAHLTTALRAGQRTSPAARSWLEMMEALSHWAVGSLARLSATASALDPDTVRPELWPYVDDPRFTERFDTGALRFRSEVAAYLAERLAQAAYLGLRMLWVDDVPENNETIVAHLEAAGADPIKLATSTEGALTRPDIRRFDIILSDMTRGDNNRAGYDLLSGLRKDGILTPVIIFAGYGMANAWQRQEVIAAGAVGGTNRADELLDLVRQTAVSILFQLGPMQIAATAETRLANNHPSDDLFDSEEPALRELADIPIGQFCTLEEIADHLQRAELISDEKDIVGHLLVFETGRQRTWLIATINNLIFVLDDANMRKTQSLAQRVVGLRDVQRSKAIDSADGSSIFQLGERDARPWYYSRSLFPSPSAIENAIHSLVAKALSIAEERAAAAPAVHDLSLQQIEARRALLRIDVDCRNALMLDIIFEAARFRPTPGNSPQLSMSRMLCGAMMVAEKLPSSTTGDDLLRALSAVLNSAVWQAEWQQLLKSFRREAPSQASRRLLEGFSRNARKALILAARNTISGDGLSTDALIRVLLTPEPDYQSSVLYRLVQNIDALRRDVEAFQQKASPERTGRDDLPTNTPASPVSRFFQRYCREIHQALNVHAAYPPNQIVSLGQIGELRNGVFIPVADLGALPGVLAPSSLAASTTDIAYTSQGADITSGNDRVSVAFHKENGVLLRLQGCRWISFHDFDQVAEAVIAKVERGAWSASWCVVTQVLEADGATVIIGGSSSARAEFSIKVRELIPDDWTSGVSLASSKSIRYSMIAQERTTPLFRLAKVKRKGLGRPQVVTA